MKDCQRTRPLRKRRLEVQQLKEVTKIKKSQKKLFMKKQNPEDQHPSRNTPLPPPSPPRDSEKKVQTAKEGQAQRKRLARLRLQSKEKKLEKQLKTPEKKPKKTRKTIPRFTPSRPRSSERDCL